MPKTGLAVAARLLKTRIGEAGDDEGRGALVLSLDPAADRRDHGVDVFLGLDARRPLGQRQAFDPGPALEAQGRERPVDVLGDRDRGIGVDDQDAFAHGACASIASCVAGPKS